MKGLVFRHGAVRVEEDLPEPVPAEGEALVAVRVAGICSTDLEIARGYMGFEGVLGHEFVGRVIGPEEHPLVGRRVVAAINCGCGVCEVCLGGDERHCRNRTVVGIVGRGGVFTERIVLPTKNLIPLPDDLPDEEAVYAEPLAAVLRITDQTEIAPADRVAVLGDGRMGLLTCGVGASLGWNITLMGRHPEKMALAPKGVGRGGPEHAGTGAFDVVVECSGSTEGFQEALGMLKPRGRLVLKTTVAASALVDLNPLVIHEIEVIGSRCGPMGRAVEFLTRPGWRPSVLTSCRYPLCHGDRAFRAAGRKDTVKVLIDVSPVV